jgi:predicted adenylyl cyclase CyaB
MQANVEIKARCHDPERVRAACLSAGAKMIRSDEQADTYYSVNHGRLKLRQSNVYGDSLIYYSRPDVNTLRESNYEIAQVTEASGEIIKLIGAAAGTHAVVRKQRDTYKWGPALINLDTVEDLGRFVEIEVNVAEAGGMEEAGHFGGRIEAALEISKDDVVECSYADLQITREASEHWRSELHKADRPGALFLLDGASCSGKTTLARRILSDPELGLTFVPRYCTRMPRPEESSQSDYVFVPRDLFAGLAASGALLEYRDFEFGMSYGLPWELALRPLLAGMDALAVMNLGNVQRVKSVLPEAVTILVDAPLEAIRKRLIARGSNTREQIEERLANAETVASLRSYYDYVVTNDEDMLEQAELTIREIIRTRASGKRVANLTDPGSPQGRTAE